MKTQAIKIEIEQPDRHPVMVVLHGLWIITKVVAKGLYAVVKGITSLFAFGARKIAERKHQATRK